MLWEEYVFRRGHSLFDLWDELFSAPRKIDLLLIAGCGFDTRVTASIRQFIDNARAAKYQFNSMTLLLIEFEGYDLSDGLTEQTKENCAELRMMFAQLGEQISLSVRLADPNKDFRVSHALTDLADRVVSNLVGKSDVVLDASSLPRVVYLSLITRLLAHFIPDKTRANALGAGGINLQVIVAEDAVLDSKIRSEDPSEDLVTIPGFGGGTGVASMAEWPVVWFPILGEGRAAQLEKVRTLASIPADAEICPVLPHPSRDPRRGDKLLIEYRRRLFDATRDLAFSSIVYAHESNPFEAYRQLRGAMDRYRKSLSPLGGCRLLVTPFSSKLMTIAAGLACFEMRPETGSEEYALGIPYAAPTRYSALAADLKAAQPVLSGLLLTGDAYIA
jgi:hypothetical protein